MHIIIAAFSFLSAWPGNWACVSTESDHAHPLRFPMTATAYGNGSVSMGLHPVTAASRRGRS